MNILTVSHLFPNAEQPHHGVFVAELVRALSKKVKTEVWAPVSHIPLLRPAKAIPEEVDQGEFVARYPRYLGLPRSLFHFRWFPFYLATRSLIVRSRFQPRAVHCHWLYPDAYAVLKWAKGMNIKTVVTIHGHAAVGLGIGGIGSSHYRTALQQVDHIIAVSSELRDILINEFATPPKKISVLHNGIDPKKFRPANRQWAREQLGLAQNRKIVLAVARLAVEKNLEMLIHAFAAIRQENCNLYIAGDGPLKEELANLIQSQNLGQKVTLLGGVNHEQLPLWYQAADVVCLSSAHEGCPVIVHEALACGKPVVSTSVGAVPDLIIRRELGLLSPPGDTAQFSANLNTALGTIWDEAAIAAVGRNSTWEALADKTVSQIFTSL